MFHRFPLSIGFTLILTHGIAQAESDDTQRLLIEQGRFWQSKGESEKSREVWSRILLIDRQQPEALYSLGSLAVKDNDLKQANEYLARLQNIRPLSHLALQLAQDIRLADSSNQKKLQEARKFASQADPEKAISLYRDILDGKPAQGTLGQEYYNTLGFTQGNDNWVEARAGLERLAREHPNDPKAALLLAKQLTYRQETRIEGIRALSQLAKREDVGSDATIAWREALVWLGSPSSAQVSLFKDFLTANPKDQKIRSFLTKKQAQPNEAISVRQDSQTTQGFKALERGDIKTAEQMFMARLKVAQNDTNALGGLGVLRQRQERLDESEKLLDKAVQQKNGAVWRKPLIEVRYWALLQRARSNRVNGNFDQAHIQLEQAIRLKPAEVSAQLALADLQRELGNHAAAETNYRQILMQAPHETRARLGLITTLIQLRQLNEANQLVNMLPVVEQEKEEVRRLRAELAQQKAREAEQRNDVAGQKSALEEAQRLYPESAWTHLDLARLLVREDKVDDAKRLMDDLESHRPHDIDAYYANALLSVELQDWQKAGKSLIKIPVKSRTHEMIQLTDEVDFNQRLQQISELNRFGHQQEAQALLIELEPMLTKPSRLIALAWAYADSGKLNRALELMQSSVSHKPGSEDANLQIEAASLAVRAGDDNFAERALHRALTLAPDDMEVLINAARVYRQQGHPSQAKDLLHRVVIQEQQSSEKIALTGTHDGLSEAAHMLADIRQELSGFLVQGMTMRSNNSESGLAKLRDTQMPFELSLPLDANRFALRITPVRLDADNVGTGAKSRFGDGPLASLAYPERSPGSQKDNGVGLAVAFENPIEGFKADLGTTPLGFLYSSAVGGMSIRRPFVETPNLNWGLQISRRAVTDSLLSFAGAEDDRTKQRWGGVTSNGGRLELGYDDRQVGGYVYGAWHHLTGKHVKDNDRVELGAGVYRYIKNDQDQQLSVGLSLIGIAYDDNLSYFTYGHGGYFSPQSFLAFGVPISWAQRTNRWTVRLRGSLGIQLIDQDAADYFPNNSAMQAEANRILGRKAEYESERTTNIGYSLAGAAEYRIDKNFVAGGHLGIDNSQDWRQWEGGFYLRYLFEDSSRALSLPVAPYKSPYAIY